MQFPDEPVGVNKGAGQTAALCPFTVAAFANVADRALKDNITRQINVHNFLQMRDNFCNIYRKKTYDDFIKTVKQDWTQVKPAKRYPTILENPTQLQAKLASSPSLEIDENVPYTLRALVAAYQAAHRRDKSALDKLNEYNNPGANPIQLRVHLANELATDKKFRDRLLIYHQAYTPSRPRRGGSSQSPPSQQSSDSAGGTQSEYFGATRKTKAAKVGPRLYPRFDKGRLDPAQRPNIRTWENWGGEFTGKEDITGGKFDKDTFQRSWKQNSPKYAALLEQIEAQDAADMKAHGHLFKHVIYTDLTNARGATTIAACMQASGYRLMKYAAEPGADKRCKIDKEVKLHLEDKTELKVLSLQSSDSSSSSSSSVGARRKAGPTSVPKSEQKGTSYRVAVLASKKLKGPHFFTGAAETCAAGENDADWNAALTNAVTTMFNDKSNVHGTNLRFVIIDSGFKEGISFKDTMHMWICEPPTSKTALDQVMGRVARFCGARNLPFDDYWKVFIHMLYSVVEVADKKAKGGVGTQCLYQWCVSDESREIAEFNSNLLTFLTKNSVDYILNQNLHTAPVLAGWKDPMKEYIAKFNIP